MHGCIRVGPSGANDESARPVAMSASGDRSLLTPPAASLAGGGEDGARLAPVGGDDTQIIDLTTASGSVTIPAWSDAPLRLTWSTSGPGGASACTAVVRPGGAGGVWRVNDLAIGSASHPGERMVGFRAGVLTQVDGPELPRAAAAVLIEAVRSVAFTVGAVPAGTYVGGSPRRVAGSAYAVGVARADALRLVSAQDPQAADGRRTRYPAEPGHRDEVAVALAADRVTSVTRLATTPADDGSPALAIRLTLTPIAP